MASRVEVDDATATNQRLLAIAIVALAAQGLILHGRSWKRIVILHVNKNLGFFLAAQMLRRFDAKATSSASRVSATIR